MLPVTRNLPDTIRGLSEFKQLFNCVDNYPHVVEQIRTHRKTMLAPPKGMQILSRSMLFNQKNDRPALEEVFQATDELYEVASRFKLAFGPLMTYINRDDFNKIEVYFEEFFSIDGPNPGEFSKKIAHFCFLHHKYRKLSFKDTVIKINSPSLSARDSPKTPSTPYTPGSPLLRSPLITSHERSMSISMPVNLNLNEDVKNQMGTTFLGVWVKPITWIVSIKNAIEGLIKQLNELNSTEHPHKAACQILLGHCQAAFRYIDDSIWAAENIQDEKFPVCWSSSTLPCVSNLFFALTETLNEQDHTESPIPGASATLSEWSLAQKYFYNMLKEKYELDKLKANKDPLSMAQANSFIENRHKLYQMEQLSFIHYVKKSVTVYLQQSENLVIFKERPELQHHGLALLVLEVSLSNPFLMQALKVHYTPDALKGLKEHALTKLQATILESTENELNALFKSQNLKPLCYRPSTKPLDLGNQKRLEVFYTHLQQAQQGLPDPRPLNSASPSPKLHPRGHSGPERPHPSHVKLPVWLSKLMHPHHKTPLVPRKSPPPVPQLHLDSQLYRDRRIQGASPIKARLGHLPRLDEEPISLVNTKPITPPVTLRLLQRELLDSRNSPGTQTRKIQDIRIKEMLDEMENKMTFGQIRRA